MGVEVRRSSECEVLEMRPDLGENLEVDSHPLSAAWISEFAFFFFCSRILEGLLLAKVPTNECRSRAHQQHKS